MSEDASKKKNVQKNKTVEEKDPEISNSQTDAGKTKAQLKAERKAKFEQEQALKAATLGETKPKALTKAERRALQESQRAAKAAVKDEPKSDSKNLLPASKQSTQSVTKVESTNKLPESATKKSPKKTKKPVSESTHPANLFKYLYIDNSDVLKKLEEEKVVIHPAVLRLGTEFKEKTIIGSNARCQAFLAAIRQLLNDYEKPPNVEFVKGFETCINHSVDFLNCCRPSSVTMQNALKYFKRQLNTLPSTISDEEAKTKLTGIIDDYIHDQIDTAQRAIIAVMQQQISDGDVILIYGFSSLIYKILENAFHSNKKFRIIVIDSRPLLEGRESLRRLTELGVECSYYLINATRYTLSQLRVSKIFLGAAALLGNGVVKSRVGSAQIALEAKGCNIPVIVACETHKSCRQAQTNSMVYNELGDPDELVNTTYKPSPLSDWRNKSNLNILNIMYDVIPADLVTAIITELEPNLPSAGLVIPQNKLLQK